MCGIAGIIGKERTDKRKVAQAMVDIITHRGPDEDGFFHDEMLSMGMRRLSIIDLSTGQQPISNEDDSKIIIFNGEIYNFQPLREDLISKGHIFKTHGDTEVLLHLYEEFGEDMLPKLRGMFVFAIYDKTAKSLFVARDYFGIKPLYYRVEDSGKIVGFGSEIKSLLCDPKYKPIVNDEAVFNYLSFQYNPLEETMFKGIYSLPPASSLTIDLVDGVGEIKKYWDYTFQPSREKNGQTIEESLKKEVLEKMRDTVKAHMISDVPVGAFLSGGIDSAVIVTLMDEISRANGYKDGKVKTFTIGFAEVSEHSEAKIVADRLQTDHHEITVSFDKEKDDEFFGKVQTYRKEVKILIPVTAGADSFTLKGTSQGCWDGGICYPP
ncbi:MAG: asparagine synthase (glutamine-hydrolyzing), partial [Candidatus Pacebacteria bacterium]|nr:asparagine synthase (glutamine-hydrolyzing) [Candidatus Paceibacterota bacterium]